MGHGNCYTSPKAGKEKQQPAKNALIIIVKAKKKIDCIPEHVALVGVDFQIVYLRISKLSLWHLTLILQHK